MAHSYIKVFQDKLDESNAMIQDNLDNKYIVESCLNDSAYYHDVLHVLGPELDKLQKALHIDTDITEERIQKVTDVLYR